MSSPTSSANSIGPMGMPKSSAALSMVSFFMPASSITSASSRYGVSARLTRKPGALFTGAGSRSMRPRKARASESTSAATWSWLTTSTSCMRETGLKKWIPTSRSGRGDPSRNCSSGMLDVLVARIAPGFIFGSIPAKILRLSSRFSGTASMIRSAPATPSPLRSGIRRSSESRTRRLLSRPIFP